MHNQHQLMPDVLSFQQQTDKDVDHKYSTSGKHLICEFGGCDSQLLANVTFLREMLERAVRIAGATPIGILSHEFDDGGASVVIGLQESHASIHTWPADGYASFDVYTCGEQMNPHRTVEEISASLRVQQSKITYMKRGLDIINRDWVHDHDLPYCPDVLRMEVLANRIHEENSPFQHIEVFETEALGRVLRLDNIMQTSEKFGFIYDEALGAMPALLRSNPKRAFVVGGGDLGTLRSLLQLKSIEQVILAEIDEAVVEVSKQYLPMMLDHCHDDPRANIVIDDARAQLATYENAFDLIASDLTDPLPDSPAEELFQPDFFMLVKKALRPDGIFAAHCGLMYFQSEEVITVVHNLRQVFEHVEVLGIPVPTYGVGPFTFLYASPQPLNISLEDLRINFANNVAMPLRYFTPEVYYYSKSLPPFAIELLGI